MKGMVILPGMSEMQWVIAYLNQVFYDISPVKEQRVEGFSVFRNLNSVRCTLVAGKPVLERKFHFYPYKSFAEINGKFCREATPVDSLSLLCRPKSTRGRSFTYSSSKQQVNNSATIKKLNPLFVTGFIDAEGCFSLGIYPSDKYRMGYRVQAIFKVTLHNKDLYLLSDIKDYFGVGSITKCGVSTLQYTVKSLKDLSIIISHFDNYPLISQK